MDHRPYYLYCNNSTGSTYSGRYEWRPYVYTGDNDKVTPIHNIFACQAAYTINISDPLWVSRQTTFTHSVGTELSGVTLRVSQSNSSEHILKYSPSAPTQLCGSDNYPIYSTQTREY